MAQTIDENLLEYPGALDRKGGQNVAGELKRRKASKEESVQEEEPKTLRERVMAARRAMDIKKRAKEKIEERVMTPARMGTNWLLRWAWTTLIPSWGLTLIYINIHVFLKAVFGEKLFCKLGDEWIPKQVQAAGGEVGKTGGRAIGIVEVMGLVLLDLALIIAIILIILAIMMILDIATGIFGWFIELVS